MIDILRMLFLFFAPNLERRRWTEVQAAWRGVVPEEEITFDDDVTDTWPLTRRTFTTSQRCCVTLGIRGHEIAYLEVDDVVTSSGETAARARLDWPLRDALPEMPPSFRRLYDRGRVRLEWPARELDARTLHSALAAVLATVTRSPDAPYR